MDPSELAGGEYDVEVVVVDGDDEGEGVIRGGGCSRRGVGRWV